LLTGGRTTVSSIYNGDANAWRPTAVDEGIPRVYHTATLLKNGQVLVTGGRTFRALGGPTSEAEIFDPNAEPDAVHPEVKGVWRPVRAAITPRFAHTATLLPSGKVLIAGGTSSNTAAGTTSRPGSGGADGITDIYDPAIVAPRDFFPVKAELFDPATQDWESAGSMATGRSGTINPRSLTQSGATAAPLKDGTVLMEGGAAPGQKKGSLAAVGFDERYSESSPSAAKSRVLDRRSSGAVKRTVLTGLGAALLAAAMGTALKKRRSSRR